MKKELKAWYITYKLFGKNRLIIITSEKKPVIKQDYEIIEGLKYDNIYINEATTKRRIK